MSKLPMTVEEITPQWLESALSKWTPGIKVAAIEETFVIKGTATKVLMKLRYGTDIPNGPPTHICVKGGFFEELRSVAGYAYAAEAEFYKHIGRNFNVPLARCWYAESDVASLQGICILDDLNPAGAQFADVSKDWTVAQAIDGLDALAHLHGPTWGHTRKDHPWLPATNPLREKALMGWLYGKGNWERAMSEPFAQYVPDSLRCPDRIRKAHYHLWAQDDVAPSCIIHGDPHPGNTYFDRNGKVIFVDWQVVYVAPPADDIAYFLSGALSIEDRRKHEQELLRGYLDALHLHGGPKISFDDFWLDYRKHLLHGFIWVPTDFGMQTAEKVAAMTKRHVAAMLDHDSLELVEKS